MTEISADYGLLLSLVTALIVWIVISKAEKNFGLGGIFGVTALFLHGFLEAITNSLVVPTIIVLAMTAIYVCYKDKIKKWMNK